MCSIIVNFTNSGQNLHSTHYLILLSLVVEHSTITSSICVVSICVLVQTCQFQLIVILSEIFLYIDTCQDTKLQVCCYCFCRSDSHCQAKRMNSESGGLARCCAGSTTGALNFLTAKSMSMPAWSLRSAFSFGTFEIIGCVNENK